jgi:hypothetical protein
MSEFGAVLPITGEGISASARTGGCHTANTSVLDFVFSPGTGDTLRRIDNRLG